MSRAAELCAIELPLNAPGIPVLAAPNARGLFSVASSRGRRHFYVDLARDPPICTCPHWAYLNPSKEEGRPCKHVEAVPIAPLARPDTDTKGWLLRPRMCHSDDSRAPEPPRRGPVGEHGLIELTASDGTRLRAYSAASTERPWAGVVILPDVRGLHPYYEDLAVRFAETGCVAIAIDYFGRTAGTDRRDESFDWKAHVEKTTPEGIAKDVRAAVDRIRGATKGSKLPIFTVGFCFGGANSWRQSAEGHQLNGCIGFYGGRPMERVGPWIPKMSAPLLMLLAGNDVATPASEFEEFSGRVRERGTEVDSHTYPGAPHSFFDRSFAEHREACRDAWERVLDFMERHRAK